MKIFKTKYEVVPAYDNNIHIGFHIAKINILFSIIEWSFEFIECERVFLTRQLADKYLFDTQTTLKEKKLCKKFTTRL